MGGAQIRRSRGSRAPLSRGRVVVNVPTCLQSHLDCRDAVYARKEAKRRRGDGGGKRTRSARWRKLCVYICPFGAMGWTEEERMGGRAAKLDQIPSEISI